MGSFADGNLLVMFVTLENNKQKYGIIHFTTKTPGYILSKFYASVMKLSGSAEEVYLALSARRKHRVLVTAARCRQAWLQSQM